MGAFMGSGWRSFPLLGLFVGVLAGTAACGSPVSPGPPVVQVPPVSPAPTPAPTPTPPDSLSVTSFTATLLPPTPTRQLYYYDVALRLSATSSGATISGLVLRVNNGDSDYDCPWETQRIVRGGQWDLMSMGYCRPYTYSKSPGSQVALDITYVDDEGHSGSLSATTPVTGP